MRERVASNQWISFRGEIELQIMQTYLDRIEADAQQSNDDNKFVRILQVCVHTFVYLFRDILGSY